MNLGNISFSLLFIMSIALGSLTACAPYNGKKFYESREKHISGHLYRNGSKIHHHPERHQPDQKRNTSELKESVE